MVTAFVCQGDAHADAGDRGERDYRVPYTESLALFAALQRQDVPSRLVIFPDEGHWIVRPQNQRLWWGEVLGWMQQWLAPERAAQGIAPP